MGRAGGRKQPSWTHQCLERDERGAGASENSTVRETSSTTPLAPRACGDADGRRVKKTTGSTSTYFVYGAFGQLAAEYSSTNPTGTTETHYLTTDHLGSTRLVTNQTGAVVSRHDYLPFGWELYSGLTGRTSGHGYLISPEAVYTPTQRFSGKERDSETRLDYFGARYYSAGPGRFASPDPTFMTRQRISDPQQWNLYAHTRNNPLKYIDPDGRDLRLASGANGKDRQYLVQNLARLYSTEKGRPYIERVERSPYIVDLSVGRLERRRLSPTSEHVTGGITKYQTSIDPATGKKSLNAAGQPGVPDAFPAIQVVVDKTNTADMGMDPAKVLAHELGGHTSNVMDLAERDPNNPSITELDRATDEADSKKAEHVGKLPGKPTPEAVKRIEEILKERNP